MNSLTHFLFALNMLLLFFRDESVLTLCLFAVVFGALLDIDQIPSFFAKKKTNFRRTWMQEPFGLVVLGIPLDIMAHYILGTPFFMVIIPYVSHLFLDYISLHEVAPYSPFKKKIVQTGFIKPFPCPEWNKQKKGISEIYILLANAILSIFLII
jgi:hypothetical protein